MEIKDTKIKELEDPRILSFWNSYYDRIAVLFPQKDVPKMKLHRHYIASTGDERKKIENQVSTCRADIDALDLEILHLQEAAALLRRRKENYNEYLDFKCSQITYINMLPDEVVSRIFLYTYAGTISLLHPKDEFWKLRNVCVRWRDIVHGNPLLWNHFKLYYVFGPSRGDIQRLTERIAERIEMCLGHSGTSPLTVSLEQRAGNNLVTPSVLRGVFRHADRLKSLELSKEMLDQALKDSGTDIESIIKWRGLSQLQELEISGVKDSFNNSCPLLLFADATSLKSVHLSGICLGQISGLRWSSVTNLDLSDCQFSSQDQLRTFFQSLPSLEELVWDTTNDLIGVGSHVPGRIELSSLRSFTLMSQLDSPLFQSRDIRKVPALPMLSMPHLTSLKIDCSGYIPSNDIDILTKGIRKAGCRLKNLTIWHAYPQEIHSILTTLHDVENLSLDSISGETYGEILNEIRLSRPYLPSLKTLTMKTFSKMQPDTESCIRDFLHSRSPSSLTYFEFCASLGHKDDEQEVGDKLRGLQVVGKELGIEVNAYPAKRQWS